MHTLHLASANAHKAHELQTLLTGVVNEIRPAHQDFAVNEDAPDFRQNALKKAEAWARALLQGQQASPWVLADDSGLEVAALLGRPGVRSARFGADEARRQGLPLPTDQDAGCRTALLRALEHTPDHRSAQMRCVLVLLCGRTRVYHTFEGIVYGTIGLEPRGQHGFGYDSLFVPRGQTKSFAELGDTVKASLSHRAAAARLLRRHLTANPMA